MLQLITGLMTSAAAICKCRSDVSEAEEEGEREGCEKRLENSLVAQRVGEVEGGEI